MNDTINPVEALANYRKTVTAAFANYVNLPGRDGELAREAAETAIRFYADHLNYHRRSAEFLVRRYERLTEQLGCDPLA